ncbi:TPA: hypothetical protein ACHJQ3_003044, partial [Escherichia coli]
LVFITSLVLLRRVITCASLLSIIDMGKEMQLKSLYVIYLEYTTTFRLPSYTLKIIHGNK